MKEGLSVRVGALLARLRPEKQGEKEEKEKEEEEENEEKKEEEVKEEKTDEEKPVRRGSETPV